MSDIECALSGVCARDPELKTSAKGTPYCSFALGVGDDGLRQWVRVVCFNEIAERVAQQLRKGGKAYAEGALDADIWKPNDGGEPRVNLNLRARRVEVLNLIGRNRPKRQQTPQHSRQPEAIGAADWQRPFDDQVGF